MHLFLTALSGLAITSGAVSPLLTRNQTPVLASRQDLNQRESRIWFEGLQQITTDQGERSWEVSFTLPSYGPESIRHISFEGGGLRAYIEWGSDRWNYGWPQLDVVADGQNHIIFRDDHVSGWATQTAMAWYRLSAHGSNRYTLKFTYFTRSYNSFTGCWGTLTLGTAMTFSD